MYPLNTEVIYHGTIHRVKVRDLHPEGVQYRMLRPDQLSLSELTPPIEEKWIRAAHTAQVLDIRA